MFSSGLDGFAVTVAESGQTERLETDGRETLRLRERLNRLQRAAHREND